MLNERCQASDEDEPFDNHARRRGRKREISYYPKQPCWAWASRLNLYKLWTLTEVITDALLAVMTRLHNEP